MPPFDPRIQTPGRIDEESWKVLDGVRSGALMLLGDMKIAEFNNEVTRWARGVGAAGRSIAYLGGKEGGGRLSAGMAQMLKEWVVAALTTPEGRMNNVADGYEGPPRSDEYMDWVREVAPGLAEHAADVTGHLTGRRAAAFDVIKQGKNGVSVGIRPNVDSRKQPKVGAVPLQYRNSLVNVAEYSKAVEFGVSGRTDEEGDAYGGLPARPIISGAVLKWMSEVAPEWAIMLERLFEDLLVEDVPNRYGLTGMWRGHAISTVPLNLKKYGDGTETVGDRLDASADRYTTGAESIAKNAEVLVMVSQGFASGEIELTPEVRKEVVNAVWDLAERVGGFDEAQVARIATAVMSGKFSAVSIMGADE